MPENNAGDVSIKIIPMTEEALPEVLEIERKSFPVPWTEQGFKEELDRPFAYLFVAKASRNNPAILGYICFWMFMGELHILNLAVHPDYRRLGIGSRLLEFALKMGNAAEVEFAVLEVRPSNKAAIRLYNRYGFVQVGIRRGYYSESNEDAIIMELAF